jgi:hypothetical protein
MVYGQLANFDNLFTGVTNKRSGRSHFVLEGPIEGIQLNKK